jgi:hypothetical protein
MLALTLTGARRTVRKEAVRAALDLIVQELDMSLDMGGKPGA